MSPPRHWIEATKIELARRKEAEDRERLVRTTLATVELACVNRRLTDGDPYAAARKVATAMENMERVLGQNGVCPEGSAGV